MAIRLEGTSLGLQEVVVPHVVVRAACIGLAHMVPTLLLLPLHELIGHAPAIAHKMKVCQMVIDLSAVQMGAF